MAGLSASSPGYTALLAAGPAGTGMGTRTGPGRTGNGSGLSSLASAGPSPSDPVVCSGSDPDSDSDQDSDPAGSGGDRRGVKRERSDREVGLQPAAGPGGLGPGYGALGAGVPGAKPGKKTRGRVKIKMEFIDNKLRRYTTFSKRKTGIMKKVSGFESLWTEMLLLLEALWRLQG